MRGRFLWTTGLLIEDLSTRDLLDVAYAAMLEDISQHTLHRPDGQQGDNQPRTLHELVQRYFDENWADRETWGMEVGALDSIPPAAGEHAP